jgi:triosephosphate isomerase
MRQPLFVANWKMHKTAHEAVAFVRELGALARGVDRAEIVVAPPFTAIAAAAEAARSTSIGVSAQDVYFEREGAFTGEVSVSMLKYAGAAYVIVGHSERRRLFADTDEWVNRKARAAVDGDLTPIVCIGETLEERESGRTLAVLDRQLRAGLAGVGPEAVAGLVLAYEPVWAIGTGRHATPSEAGEAHAHIRAWLSRAASPESANRCRILYGGSVKPDNIGELAALPDVDGALVGGASLEPTTFFEIVKRGRRVVD